MNPKDETVGDYEFNGQLLNYLKALHDSEGLFFSKKIKWKIKNQTIKIN